MLTPACPQLALSFQRKRKCDEPLSNSAFTFILRRYNKVANPAAAVVDVKLELVDGTNAGSSVLGTRRRSLLLWDEVGRCRLTPVEPRSSNLFASVPATIPQPFHNRSTTVPQPFHNRSTTVPQPFQNRYTCINLC